MHALARSTQHAFGPPLVDELGEDARLPHRPSLDHEELPPLRRVQALHELRQRAHDDVPLHVAIAGSRGDGKGPVGIGLRDVSVIGPGELPIAAHSSDNGDSRPAVSRAAAAGSSAGSHHVSSCENDDGSGRLVVRILSLRSGRDDLVLAARRLCERVQAGKLAATQIDETAIESEVCANAGFPEPELILQSGPELHLGGLLPWHCRVTQFAHLGPLGEVRAETVHRALFEYAGVQQRHGR